MTNYSRYPQSKQQEVLEELGARLRQFRIDQSISIEEVAEKTRIRVSLLKAIEDGQLDALPEPVYIRGLLKQFADVLGWNGDDFAHQFPTERILKVRNSPWLKFRGLGIRPIHLYILYIFVVLGSVNTLSLMVQRSIFEVSQESSPDQVESQPEIVIRPGNPQPLSEETIQSASSLSTPLIEQVVVDITLQDQCWLKIVVDGKTEFEGTLPKGTHQTWTATEKLTVRTGNAGGVLVAVNDEQAKQLGKPGEVKDVTYQADSES